MSLVLGQYGGVGSNLFIQSGNALISRLAQWVGAIPSSIGVNASAFVSGVITASGSATSLLAIGDMVGYNLQGPFAMVTAVNNTAITISDPDGIWLSATFPTPILKIPSSSTVEIFACIQMAELKMRRLELPGLRSNPYDSIYPSTLTTDANGMAPIPADMNWPVLFFQDSQPSSGLTTLGPWIIYDRVGDRNIIKNRMTDQLYIRPLGTASVIRASFSEVGPNYIFSPNPGVGTTIKAYYYKTFSQLFTTTGDLINPIIQTNPVLATFPEGYFYASLWAYYAKNKNDSEAGKWGSLFDDAYGEIEDQNNAGKWRGGDLHLTSEFQPRVPRFSTK
jgi:hypothetical protein